MVLEVDPRQRTARDPVIVPILRIARDPADIGEGEQPFDEFSVDVANVPGRVFWSFMTDSAFNEFAAGRNLCVELFGADDMARIVDALDLVELADFVSATIRAVWQAAIESG